MPCYQLIITIFIFHKQIIQTEHNIVENHNWQEENQSAIYKHGQGFELGATEKLLQVVVKVLFEENIRHF